MECPICGRALRPLVLVPVVVGETWPWRCPNPYCGTMAVPRALLAPLGKN